MEDFHRNKEALNRELDQFLSKLEDMLPRYNQLLKKDQLSDSELAELGNIEHYLIELNAKIIAIKEMLQQDLFGHSLDTYFKLKHEVERGGDASIPKLLKMRSIFQEALTSGAILNWN